MSAAEGRDAVELRRRRAEEYEMQLFGFHSRTAFAALNQKIKENVDLRCHKMYTSIKKSLNPDDEEDQLLKENIKQLKKAYMNNMKPTLGSIENIINKFISIPNNVLLEEDKLQAIQYSDEEFLTLERRLENLQQNAKRVTIFNALLKEELEITEQLKESEDLARKLCDVIEKGLSTKKLNSKSLQAIEKCKDLKESLSALKSQSDKDIYNPLLNEKELENIILT